MKKQILRNFKTRINSFRKNKVEKLKVFVKNSKTDLPKSRLKRYAYGMATTLSICGLLFLSGPLVAFAKDLPADARPKPTDVNPSPPAPSLHPSTVTKLSGAASMLCGLAVGSGSFAIGALCGAVVGIGILISQGKIKIGGGK